MALNIKDPEAHRLARELAAATGETLTGAVVAALGERLERVRERRRRRARSLADELDEISRHCGALPVRDPRAPEAILGTDDKGGPGRW